MNTLILNQAPSSIAKYSSWCGEEKYKTVIYTKRQFLNGFLEQDFKAVIADECANQLERIAECIEIAKKYSIERVVAFSEFDIEFAGLIRDLLNINGQRFRKSELFRNKFKMKTLVKELGIEVPAFSRVSSTADVSDFAKIEGYPIVVKPIDGAGGVNTVVLNNQTELIQNNAFWDNFNNGVAIVEKYIYGSMYHIDGFILEGKTLFSMCSRYVGTCLDFQKGNGLASHQLTVGSEIDTALKNYTERLITQICDRFDNFPFHLEVFQNEENDLIFCEIASRIGGAMVNDTTRLTLGVDLAKVWMRSPTLESIHIEKQKYSPVNKITHIHGWGIVPKVKGIIEAIPLTCPFPFVVMYETHGVKGEKLDSANNAVDSIISFIVKGTSDEDLLLKIRKVYEWVDCELEVRKAL